MNSFRKFLPVLLLVFITGACGKKIDDVPGSGSVAFFEAYDPYTPGH